MASIKSDSLVVVANRLPVEKVEQPGSSGSEWRTSPGGLVSALAPILESSGGTWIGWSGTTGDEAPSADGDFDLVPVDLSSEEVADYYEGFSNATLWPLYHDVTGRPVFERRWWEAYVKVNRRFSDLAARVCRQGSTVWVQDYQLQLVPAMLRGSRPDLRIGWFNHIPFPGYEIYSRLPWRTQVVEGLLGADLLGFQRRDDAANFLRAARGHAAVAHVGRS